MSFPSLARELWRSRRLVAGVAVLAAIVALLMIVVEGRGYRVGVARAAALLDTERSQAVDALAGGSGITALEDRAKLLADLMTRSPLKDEIADAAGVPRTELITVRPMNGLERRLTVAEVTRLSVDEGDPRASILRVGVTELAEGESPIIAVDVRAPDAGRAARLADQAIASVGAYVDRAAPAKGLRSVRRLKVRQLEPAIAATASQDGGAVGALLAGVGVFALGCGAIVGAARLRAARHRPAVAPAA
jgi:hypothetical protein